MPLDVALSFRYGLAWVLAGICQRGAEITMPFVSATVAWLWCVLPVHCRCFVGVEGFECFELTIVWTWSIVTFCDFVILWYCGIVVLWPSFSSSGLEFVGSVQRPSLFGNGDCERGERDVWLDQRERLCVAHCGRHPEQNVFELVRLCRWPHRGLCHHSWFSKCLRRCTIHSCMDALFVVLVVVFPLYFLVAPIMLSTVLAWLHCSCGLGHCFFLCVYFLRQSCCTIRV